MLVSTRSYLISGVALLGAGAVALAPIQPTLGAAPAVSSPAHFVSQAVELAAATNPITRILQVWDTTETNFAGLLNAEFGPVTDPAIPFQQAPLPALQQFVANWLGYAQQLPDVGGIFQSIIANAQAVIGVPFGLDLNSLDEAHASIYSLLPEGIQPSVAFTTSYLTGALLGLVGPIVAPILALSNSVHAIVNNFLDGEFIDAITETINIPANLVDAFLNGGPSLDLGPLLTRLGVLPISPTEGVQVTDLQIALGGLLSAGGSLFNSLGLTVAVGQTEIPIPGVGPGAIGSLIGLGGAFAGALGWNGTGNPLNGDIPVPGPAGAAAAAKVAAENDDDSGLSSQADASDSAAGAGAVRSSGKGVGKSPRKTSASSSSDSAGGASADQGAAKTGKGGAGGAKRSRGHAA